MAAENVGVPSTDFVLDRSCLGSLLENGCYTSSTCIQLCDPHFPENPISVTREEYGVACERLAAQGLPLNEVSTFPPIQMCSLGFLRFAIDMIYAVWPPSETRRHRNVGRYYRMILSAFLFADGHRASV